jgi:two-component system, NarL family, response regulator NreC
MSFHILVVDDYQPWRQKICSMLQTRPELRVIAEAEDGLEAVQKARELKPDLILLDINLPSLNGIEAALKIREASPDARIIFVSQINDDDVMKEALATGAAGYVLKVRAVQALLPAMEAALRNVTYAAPN